MCHNLGAKFIKCLSDKKCVLKRYREQFKLKSMKTKKK